MHPIFVAGEAQVNAAHFGRPFNAFLQKLGNVDPWHHSWSTILGALSTLNKRELGILRFHTAFTGVKCSM